jgi:hypothetical protein
MIYHQQQRLKEKLSSLDNKTDEEPSLNNRLPDLISNTKPVVSSLSNNLPLPSLSTYQTSFLPSPNFSMF